MIVYDSCPVCGSKNILPVLTARDYTVSHEDFEIWECRHCTLRFTQNVPEQEDIGLYYQSEDYISHSDTTEGLVSKLYHKVRKHTLQQKRSLVEKFTHLKKGNILDIGCGTGAFLNTMHKASWTITGLEPDENARQKAMELYGLKAEMLDTLFSLPAENLDAITMWHVLEHVHDLHGYVSQLKNLLKPAGNLFIAVPNHTSYDEEVYKEFWAAYDVPRHLYHFSPQSMQELLAMHDFEIISKRPMWYDSFYVSMLSEKYRSGKSKMPAAILNGILSNSRAIINTDKCSSVIYVAQAANFPSA